MLTIETPGGTVDGANDTFTLSVSPTLLILWKNGLYMNPGSDYTLVGSTITFAVGQIPPTGAVLAAALAS